MFLTNPASYVTLAELKADTTLDLTDPQGNAIPDAVLNEWLSEESGSIDRLIGQTFLPQEMKIRRLGNGSNFLSLNVRPLIYIKQVKIVLPNSVGFDVPVQSLLVDFEHGTLENMTPLTFQGLGITTLFPDRLPIDVTVGWGLGLPIPPPTFTVTPIPGISGGSYPAGEYDVVVTSVTYSGESLASAVQTVTLANPGAIYVLITNSPGAMRYYAYACPHGEQPIFRAETQAYAIGAGTISTTFDNTPSTDVIAFNSDGTPRQPPTVDTSMAPFLGQYAALKKATKLMLQCRAWEMKNPTNRGLFEQRSGPKMVAYRESIHSTLQKILDDLTDAFSYQGID